MRAMKYHQLCLKRSRERRKALERIGGYRAEFLTSKTPLRLSPPRVPGTAPQDVLLLMAATMLGDGRRRP
jgi:hypothetical protein